MGLFYNNNEAGSGVAKRGPQKKPFFRFVEVFADKFWTLFQINLIYFLFCIPLITFGPATAALTAVMRNIYLGRPQFVFHEFWTAFKKNFKQSYFIGLIDLIFIFLAAFSYVFYTSTIDDNDYYWLLYALTMAAEVIFLMLNFYIYPQIAALNLKMGAILKNSMIMSFLNIKGNLIALACFIVYIVLIMFFGLYVLMLAPIIPFAWLSLITMFTSYPAIQKFIINPFYEQQGLKNPELPDYDEDDEEAVFEDKGGEEAPIKLKKNDKKGRVIK